MESVRSRLVKEHTYMVIIESNGTESKEQDTSSRSRNDAHVDDADIRPIYAEEPMAEISLTNVKANKLLMSVQAPFLNVQMTFEQRSSSLVLHQMTSDHNRSELEIHDHSNEPSSSKLVPKVVPLAVKTATSRQELELLFHHHIAMLRTTDQASVFMAMMSDHHSSDLAPQQQMASAENNTSCPVPQCSHDVCSHQFRPRSSSNDF
ncbi:hypothetical protein Tco_1282643 [Tanacetum coccineum]